ncbi:MAG: 6-phosphogluconolactonase [Hyphomicrobiales bacterium]|uniref:6-phosphogluconolactonase n=1 Tax=Nisaea sp. TaxID=2024842 RepID=UPI003287F20A
MSGTQMNLADKDSLAEGLANQIAEALNSELQANGRAVLAVSGGSTPKRFFEKLSLKDIDWAGVTVTLVDERWVDESSDRSNAALVRANLLQNKAASANFFPLFTGDATPEDGVKTLEAEFTKLGQPITAAVLGMGGDGHTASFFPEGDNLASAVDLENPNNFITMLAPGAGEPRITFTLSALLKANFLALHIEGDEKQGVLAKALTDGPVVDLPIRSVLRQEQTELTIFWCP